MKNWEAMKNWIFWGLWVPLVLVSFGIILIGTFGPYPKDKSACEAQGRFYWRGNCLPKECEVVRP
jgi:hypothetical protein